MRHFVLVTLLFACQAAIAQEQPRYLVPVAGESQKLAGSAAANDGAIGFDGRKTDAGFRVAGVTSGSPAQKSGILVGDVITSIDDKSVVGMTLADFAKLLTKRPGETVHISYVRGNQQFQVALLVDSRAKVYPEELNMHPSVSQLLFDGHLAIVAAVSQAPSQPQSVMVWFVLSNLDAPLTAVDDSKFFVLDGQGQQLRHLSLDEVKYSIQSWLAQNWHGGNYPRPTPPPPQRRYVITGSENGNYTFSEMGNTGTLSGNSSSTYDVQEQPDYNQAGYMLGYTIGQAIRQHADRKHNEQIMTQAQQTLAQWDANYFKSQSPLIPGENRTGGVLFWTGSARQATGPFKIVLFLTNPGDGKQEMVRFEFH